MFKKSKSEERADAGVRTLQRGRANTKDAALILGIAPATCKRRMLDGELPYVQIGGTRYVSIEVLRAHGGVLPPPSLVKNAKSEWFTDELLQDSNLDNESGANGASIYD